MDLYPHKSGLGKMEPVAQIGQNVGIIYGSATYYRKVTYLEPYPPFQFLDLGALAAQTTSGQTAAPNLAVFDNEFGQFRWWPIDHIEVLTWLPQADGKYRMRNLMVPVNMDIVVDDPCLHLTEFMVWEDNTPFFDGRNYTDYALTAARLRCIGFRFSTVKLDEIAVRAIKAGAPCTYIVASGKTGEN